MNGHPRDEIAALKASLMQGEDLPGESLLRRHPMATTAIAFGTGLILSRNKPIARSVIAMARLASRQLLSRGLSQLL